MSRKKGCIPWNKGKPSPFKGKKLAEIVGEDRAKEIGQKISKKVSGIPAWSKGLTKETHPSLQRSSEKHKGISSWNKGLTKETNQKIMDQAEWQKIYNIPWNKDKKSCYNEKHIKNFSEGQQRRRKNNHDEWYGSARKGGINYHKKYPGKASEIAKETHRKHPGLYNEVAKETNRKWRERDPEDYYKKKNEYCQLMLERSNQIKKENPEYYNEFHIRSGIASMKSRMENSPYFWNGVPFLSKEEMKCAKLILKEPINGINCNVCIGRKTIDFYPQEYDLKYHGMFVEFHPYDWRGKLHEEYKKERQQAIDNSQYKGTELIVIKSLKEVE